MQRIYTSQQAYIDWSACLITPINSIDRFLKTFSKFKYHKVKEQGPDTETNTTIIWALIYQLDKPVFITVFLIIILQECYMFTSFISS